MRRMSDSKLTKQETALFKQTEEEKNEEEDKVLDSVRQELVEFDRYILDSKKSKE